MNIINLHSWSVTPSEAILIQQQLGKQLCLDEAPDLARVRMVAGADVSMEKDSGMVVAAVVVMSFPGLKKIEERWARREAGFPYVPGLLAFREGPALLQAFRNLEHEPDLLLFDGQGIAHPRGLGIASHLGLILDRPSVGVAKSVLVGTFREPAPEPGSFTPLFDEGLVVGAALRTRYRVKPVFVSPGHKIDYNTAIEACLRCCRGYRLPEPVRAAHILAGRLKKG